VVNYYCVLEMQVPRASASAVAFGLGLLSGKGKLGAGKNRAFSVLSESRASDICLRFFDSCQTYKVLSCIYGSNNMLRKKEHTLRI
jgi:multiple inositol-polyphosphate phosphatase/2,3-bisphosphoglycerate 3-phosphatase